MGIIYTIFSFLRTGTGKVIGYVVGGLSLLLLLARVIRARDKDKAKIKDLEEYKETRKKVDNAIEDAPDNYDDAREFLRKRRDK